MKLIKIEKLTGAKRLHRAYTIENILDASFEFEHEITSNRIEFQSIHEQDFLDKIEDINKERQILINIKSREENIPKVEEVVHEQKTIEWLEARAGNITASDTPFGVNGTPIPTFKNYVYKKVSEKIRIDRGLDMPPKVITEAMDSGNELEELAIKRYSEKTSNLVVSKGLIKSTTNLIGASVDGISTDDDFNRYNIEVKNVNIPRYLSQLSNKHLEREYYAQMQIQMYITNTDKTHFVVQCSEDIEIPIIISTVERDETFINNALETLYKFEDSFNKVYDLFKDSLSKI